MIVSYLNNPAFGLSRLIWLTCNLDLIVSIGWKQILAIIADVIEDTEVIIKKLGWSLYSLIYYKNLWFLNN